MAATVNNPVLALPLHWNEDIRGLVWILLSRSPIVHHAAIVQLCCWIAIPVSYWNHLFYGGSIAIHEEVVVNVPPTV